MNKVSLLLLAFLISSCSKKTTKTTHIATPQTGIEWTFKKVTYTGDSATYLNGAYQSFDTASALQNPNEILVFFTTPDIASGVYPVISVLQKIASTNCQVGMLMNGIAYNCTGSSGSVTVINGGNISSITFSNVEMLTAGSDSAMLNGNIVTQ